ncbi:hypothetical protein PT7_3515 [Pusillimonas sp. T7-7]|uniref:zinc-ribbon and DUF3426 domain-containing protein n=1 Tax=Pusillimonas sp. (strain T7-7) TaxID=1007105 RepID=UPI00020843AB|nr:zinc-ribbon and DUF3426 domain-containing protein [Pusillimonas sp. T7-7]AEC22055.1 hypothetical protein PT7_3515 [Pusillimonas sp. T7-7]
MDLTTRCPECGTTFSASLAQLQLRKGYIRCINCAHIFDGFDAVVSSDAAAARSMQEPSAQQDMSAPQETPVHREPSMPMPRVLRQRPAANNEPEHHITPAAPSRGPAFTISAEAGRQTPGPAREPAFRLGTDNVRVKPEPTVGAARLEAVEPVVHDAASGSGLSSSQVYVEPRNAAKPIPEDRVRSTDFVGHDASAGGLGRLLWRLLVLLGLLLLLAQLAYVYRAQIANNVAALRPVLERACVPLECKIPYARQIDQISIMSSSLRSGTGAAVGSAQADQATAQGQAAPPMLLQLTMRNTYDKPQEWPTLVLDLTDLSGTRVVRKNLPPESYLPAEALSQPFKAGSEISVSVPIILKDVKANGYQLDKFFE